MKISPSQINFFRRCKRLIGYRYVENKKPPPNSKQAFGISLHAQLERWLREGVVPDESPEGLTAKQGLQSGWLPPPRKARVEHKWEIEITKELSIGGIVDCVWSDYSTCEVLVVDHKSTSDLHWALDPDALFRDPQALLYALYGMLGLGFRRVRARWIYYAATNPREAKRKPAGARAVECLFDAHDSKFQEEVEKIINDLMEIAEIRATGKKGLELEPRPESCGAYGGCDFRADCQLSLSNVESYLFKKIADTK